MLGWNTDTYKDMTSHVRIYCNSTKKAYVAITYH